jgi:hypothetical protein
MKKERIVCNTLILKFQFFNLNFIIGWWCHAYNGLVMFLVIDIYDFKSRIYHEMRENNLCVIYVILKKLNKLVKLHFWPLTFTNL